MENYTHVTEGRVPQLDRNARREIATELWRALQLMSSKIVVTFSTDCVQIIAFPPSGESYKVPAGPHSLTVRDGVVEESW